MSGQPYKYASDVEDFRRDYMAALGMRANLDDANLQANKQFKDTGSLPPQSTIKDTRTTPEILADTEKLKLNLIAELKPVCSTGMAQLVVQRIQQSPFNADGSLLVWFAQNAPELVTQLKKKYKFGIVGDDNDVEQMVAFIVYAFSATKELSGTVKSAFNRPTSSFRDTIDVGDLDKIKREFDEIIYRLLSKIQNVPAEERVATRGMNATILETANQFKNLEKLLKSPELAQMKSIFINAHTEQQQHNFTDTLKDLSEGYKEYNDFVETLPPLGQLKLLLSQLDKSIVNANPSLSLQIVSNIKSLLPTNERINKLETFIANVLTTGIPSRRPKADPYATLNVTPVDKRTSEIAGKIATLQKELIDLENRKETEELSDEELRSIVTKKRKLKELERLYSKTPEGKLPQVFTGIETEEPTKVSGADRYERYKEERLKKTNIPLDNPYFEPYISDADAAARQRKIDERKDAIARRDRESEQSREIIAEANSNLKELNKTKQELIKEYTFNVNEIKRESTNAREENDNLRILKESFDERIDAINNAIERQQHRKDAVIRRQKETHPYPQGEGLKKRRGRPKGSGVVKPLAERIDHTKGIKQGHTHVPFGKYILNKNKLDSDQVYFKHTKGYGVKGFPMTKVSNKLGHVLRTIIGGGVPKFEELNGLSEQEKEYLHKVANKAGIMDKLSIPAPSKDKLEQDIHQFEVMKGELLSGNDSPEMIKKFKLLLLRLSKNGTLPKREATELMEELIQLGY